MSSFSTKSRTVALAVWMTASIFYGYQYILRVMPNIMIDEIMEQFNLSSASFGQFSGIYYIGYSLIHIPVGILLDRFGPKKVMTGCILLTTVGLAPLIFSDHWIYPTLGRLLIGIGSSAAILGVFKIIRMIFSEKRFPRMLSLSVTIGLVGAIYGGGPVSYMRDTLGYQSVVQILIAGGVLLALATYWIVPDIKEPPKASVLSNIKEVLTHRKVVFSCLLAGLMVGPLEGFADVWGTVYLKQVYGYEGTLAASLPSMIFVGMCFGAPVLSFIADKAKSYLGTIVGAAVVMALSFGLLVSSQMPSAAISVCFVIVGICCAYQILAIYKASTYVREEVAGLTTAVANMIIMIFGYVFHAIIGSIVGKFGGPSSGAALIAGVSVIPVALILAAIGYGFLWSRERKSVEATN